MTKADIYNLTINDQYKKLNILYKLNGAVHIVGAHDYLFHLLNLSLSIHSL